MKNYPKQASANSSNHYCTLPNILSSLRIILTPIFVGLFFRGDVYLLAALAVFTFAALTDSWDGYYARKHGFISSLGTFLDPIADKILISSTLISFACVGVVAWWVIALIVVRDTVITFLRLRLLYQGTSLVTSQLGKIKTVAQFVAIYVMFLCVIGKWLGVDQIWYNGMLVTIKIIMYGVVGLTVYSGIDYLKKYQDYKRHKRKGSV